MKDDRVFSGNDFLLYNKIVRFDLPPFSIPCLDLLNHT